MVFATTIICICLFIYLLIELNLLAIIEINIITNSLINLLISPTKN